MTNCPFTLNIPTKEYAEAQEMFKHFVKHFIVDKRPIARINPLPATLDSITVPCTYTKVNGVGCAIGCQPWFKDEWRVFPFGVRELARQYPETAKYLGEPGSVLNLFAGSLQSLHDRSKGKYMSREAVEIFAHAWMFSSVESLIADLELESQ